MPLLLIDDDEHLRPLMAEYLTKRGSTVCSCGSIAEAQKLFMEMAEIEPPDTVILDERLPDGRGIDFCRSMQVLFPATRWILISGNHDMDELEQAKAAGAMFIAVDKPMSLRSLNELATKSSVTAMGLVG
jgi:two-component system response regulator DevR